MKPIMNIDLHGIVNARLQLHFETVKVGGKPVGNLRFVFQTEGGEVDVSPEQARALIAMRDAQEKI